jgi:hypothetical protein
LTGPSKCSAAEAGIDRDSLPSNPWDYRADRTILTMSDPCQLPWPLHSKRRLRAGPLAEQDSTATRCNGRSPEDELGPRAEWPGDEENSRRTSHYGESWERRSVILTYHPAKRTTHMTRFATTVLAAVTLMQPALSVASVQPTDSHAKPNSFVPHAHTNNHVYGTPIQPAIVGHAKTSHHKQTPKKRSPSAANRDSR